MRGDPPPARRRVGRRRVLVSIIAATAALAATFTVVVATTDRAVAAAPTVAGPPTVHAGSVVTIFAQADPGQTIGIWFHRAGQPAGYYDQRRTLVADSTGSASTTYVADADYRYYATTSDGRSDTLLTRVLVTTISGPAQVARGATVAITGQVTLPGSKVAVYFHSAGQPASYYSLRRTLTADSAGRFHTAYVADADYRYYAVANGVRSAGALTRLRLGPVIVLDPGHSVAVNAVDPATGLVVSDYENEPEMQDVFAVAVLVRARLQAAGYRVVMTKNSVGVPTSLAQRAAIANRAGAALAVSIHDQAGANGGVGFDRGNNVVYYQSVGTYRATPAGRRVVFTNAKLAALSARYGRIFGAERGHAEQHPVTVRGDVGYDLGTRGLPAGNIWMVQLLSRVPWIYNEAGGNSAGMVGLNPTDRIRYADALVASIEHCVPIPR
jgi:N-acetylmuramoyl-L-alanine amidase